MNTTYDLIGFDLLQKLDELLSESIDDAFFQIVRNFPEHYSDVANSEKLGFLRLISDERFFSQDRIFNIELRVAVLENPAKPYLLNAFVEQVKRFLQDLGYIPGIWSGLRIHRIFYSVEFQDGYIYADIPLELLWVHDRPINLNGTELKQFILTESIEDATITADGSFTLDANSLQDRDASTDGLSGTFDGTERFVTIDFGASTTVDYILLGNLSLASSTTFKFYYWTGSAWTEHAQKTITTDDITDTGGHVYYELRSKAATKFRLGFQNGGAFTLSFVFMGTRYEFNKSYDIQDSSIGINTSEISVTTDLDNPKGYRFASQSAGSRKDYWDVTWGMRKSWFDDLVTDLLSAQINVKNVMFKDTYRDTKFHVVKLQDSYMRNNQLYQDYLKQSALPGLSEA
jgi:hypothetical protein